MNERIPSPRSLLAGAHCGFREADADVIIVNTAASAQSGRESSGKLGLLVAARRSIPAGAWRHGVHGPAPRPAVSGCEGLDFAVNPSLANLPAIFDRWKRRDVRLDIDEADVDVELLSGHMRRVGVSAL